GAVARILQIDQPELSVVAAAGSGRQRAVRRVGDLVALGRVDVGRALAAAVTALRRVTGICRRTADGGGGSERVGWAGVAGAVAALGDVTDAGGRTADRRALFVCRAGRVDAVAGLRDVTDAGCPATGGRGPGERVGRTGPACRAGTLLRRIASPCRRSADG